MSARCKDGCASPPVDAPPHIFRCYRTESVHYVILQKPFPAQIRPHVVYTSNDKEYAILAARVRLWSRPTVSHRTETARSRVKVVLRLKELFTPPGDRATQRRSVPRQGLVGTTSLFQVANSTSLQFKIVMSTKTRFTNRCQICSKCRKVHLLPVAVRGLGSRIEGTGFGVQRSGMMV